MKIILECREIRELPLIEREVSVNNNKLTVTFSLIGDLKFLLHRIMKTQNQVFHMTSQKILLNSKLFPKDIY